MKLGCISQCVFPWLLYCQELYKPSWMEQAGQMLSWADKFYVQDSAKEASSHHPLGLYWRIDPLTLAGGCWLWFRSSRQFCSLRRQERYSSLRLSNSERSSLHCGGEYHQGHHQFCQGESPGKREGPLEVIPSFIWNFYHHPPFPAFLKFHFTFLLSHLVCPECVHLHDCL